MQTRIAILAISVAVSNAVAGTCAAEAHSEKMALSLTLFKTDVRTVLVEHCVKCHGGATVRSRFDLTTREGLLAGGAIGVSVIAGDSKQSPIIHYLTHRGEPFMPPEQPQLSEETIAKIARWIDLGAAYDKPLVDRAPTRAGSMQVTDTHRAYWAFAQLRDAFPEGASIDSFIRTKQKEKQLTAAPEASNRTLIRRSYFDVTGLPPQPAAIEAFLADKSPDAYETLVDRLLASPHFGERWARHWLDVARFAESHGFEHDYDRKFAFPFRDFVIRAFNQDMPYDQFVRWQLAGDELAPDDSLALMASGFLAAGPHPTQITINEAERIRYDEMDDMLATTGSAMLALTVGCARCHDHKYDPIPTRDYYRMLSAFTTTVRTEVNIDLGSLDGESAAGIAAPGATRKPHPQTVMISSEGEQIRAVRLHTSSDRIPDFYKETYFLNRGDPAQKGGVADLGFLQVLTRTSDTTRWMNTPHDKRTSGRRAALSHWMTDVESGAGHLLARVIVNRLWQHYFGRGIVATPNDFGSQGDRPTHPELLDWLATELIRHGWRLKPIHKLILMSDTYRMGGLASAENETIDSDNQFLWRRHPRRLEAEAIRDNALAVGGVLDETMFGAGTLDENTRRRSIYFTVKRSRLVPSMQTFDWPDALTSMERRAVTTTPSQALVFINDPQFRQMAEGFAGRIANAEDWIGAAYMIAYGRPPSQRERTLSEAFVRRQTRSRNADVTKALTDFCAAIMSANEFIYIE
jgi:cytochrome c553